MRSAPGATLGRLPRVERLGCGLGGRYYPTTKEVTERIAVIARERRLTSSRIEALITVICFALLLFSLVERAVRQALHPAIKLAGLPP